MVNRGEKKQNIKIKLQLGGEESRDFQCGGEGKEKTLVCVIDVPCLQRGESGSLSLKRACEVTGYSFSSLRLLWMDLLCLMGQGSSL